MKESSATDNEQTTVVFGVNYTHQTLPNGDELYFTDFGLPLRDCLQPEHFLSDQSWFRNHSERLEGTSCVYKVTTKPVAGRQVEVVLKWNRMGQDIPGLFDGQDLFHAEFNSPFEEFAYVTELRHTRHESPGAILTHKPLAIYIPHKTVALDRLGRKSYKMDLILSQHEDIKLNAHRSYGTLYEWIKGMDAVQAFKQELMTETDMQAITLRSRSDLNEKGFEVADSKPHHVIVRQNRQGKLVCDRKGRTIYALIDFELLKRTEARERQKRMTRRQIYLNKQAHRFDRYDPARFPPHLMPVEIMGVEYIYGPVEATGGRLWVVGRDPSLFDYFLPDQWRNTPRVKLSALDQLYRTTTEDDIHLVWRVSRVGEIPDMDPLSSSGERIIQHGYNSPFEEVALAIHLRGQGIPTTYPRAIYRASSKAAMHDNICDDRRYATHEYRKTPDHKPVLEKNHDYIIFWGFWNGPDELLAQCDESPFEGLDVLLAYRKGLLDKAMYIELMEKTKQMLRQAGVEDLNPLGNHILVSVDNTGQLVKDCQGLPEIRLFNFEFLANIT
jgi:hypothetical protein